MPITQIIELSVKAVIGLAIIFIYGFCVINQVEVPPGLDRVLLIVLGGYYVGDVISDVLRRTGKGE